MRGWRMCAIQKDCILTKSRFHVCLRNTESSWHFLLRPDQTMRKLPLREDYPSVSLSQLFDYIETHGPIVHPVLGEMSRFLSYEREFLPLPTDVPGRHEVVAQIHKDLSNWRKYQRIRGYIVLEQCGKTMDETIVRMPNVSFLPTDDARGLQNIWMCDGDPFAPTFVVEVNTLRGPNSQFDALDAKMRHEYFTHGV
ncbi:hypothetical protein Poli38472_003114 [Pythium oligandrum]|uniref:Uncharacterized protein n=1 Tax=Pythium oligandrum TaxID=41045 RepID=A0A8K1C5Y2_PYTOL|nr:hypothetical protein Poli38472_003114 [Pythium oligandrum]|eukprot:TMW57189.1 hypothetical protein Poli38472_003114 [Pythium oligandrum]